MEGLRLTEGKKDRQIKRGRQDEPELTQSDVDGDDAQRERLVFGLLY